MKKIKLTRGKYTIVDDEDFEYLSQFKWQFDGNYAGRSLKGRGNGRIRMHNELTIKKPGHVVDHINKDKLDNRKSNLRIVTQSNNMQNINLPSNNKSGILNVHFDNIRKKYRAKKRFNNKFYEIGRFDTIEECKKALDNFMKKLHE